MSLVTTAEQDAATAINPIDGSRSSSTRRGPGTTDQPFFIVGSGRSGTTLLRLILAGHSRISIPPETWFLIPLVKKFPLENALSPAEVQSVVETIVSHPRWQDLEIGPQLLAQRVNGIKAPRLSDIINVVYEHHGEIQQKQRVGDKTPRYIEIVPAISTLYPGCKFIHLIRDGRDVAASFANAGFHGRAYHGSRFEWCRAVAHGRALRSSSLAQQILDVRFEDLAKDPATTTQQICSFLSEEFEPEMLDWQRRVDQVPLREMRIHGNLRRPIAPETAGAWRERLSTIECLLIEASIGDELQRLDYDLRFGKAWSPLRAVLRVLLTTSAPLLDRAVPALQRRGFIRSPYFM